MRPTPSAGRIVQVDYLASLGVIVPVVLWGLALIGASVALMVAALLQGEGVDPRWLRRVVTIGFLGHWVFLPYVRAWQATVRPWRQCGGRLGLQGVATEEGITSNASPAGELDLWSCYLKADVSEDLVSLVAADGMVTILPREFFASDFDWQSFCQMVEFKVVSPS
ncbi:MAG: hypothetical protein GX605_03525 [Chloroflexi bacterium]|nr:hypothetical protein [Chloroflexota bacterium]